MVGTKNLDELCIINGEGVRDALVGGVKLLCFGERFVVEELNFRDLLSLLQNDANQLPHF